MLSACEPAASRWGGHVSGRKAVLHVTNLVPRAWFRTLLAFGWFGCFFFPFRCGCCRVVRLDALHPRMVALAFLQGKSAPPFVFCTPFPAGVPSLLVHAVLVALHRCPYGPRTDRHLQLHVYFCIGIHFVYAQFHPGSVTYLLRISIPLHASTVGVPSTSICTCMDACMVMAKPTRAGGMAT